MFSVYSYIVIVLLTVCVVILLRISNICATIAGNIFSVQETLREMRTDIGRFGSSGDDSDDLEAGETQEIQGFLSDTSGLLAEFAKTWRKHICTIQNDVDIIKGIVLTCSHELMTLNEQMESKFPDENQQDTEL